VNISCSHINSDRCRHIFICSNSNNHRKRSRWLLLGGQTRLLTHLTPQEKTRNQWNAIQTQLQSIPNMITTTRILFTPFLSYWILTGQYKYALYGCAVAGFTDWVDGYIAKHYDKGTVLGTYLDPLADKILINTLALSLALVQYHHPLLLDPSIIDTTPFLSSTTTIDCNDSYNNNHHQNSERMAILPYWCVLTWLSRDVFLIYFSYRAAAIATQGRDHNVADPSRTPLKVDPSVISKVNTLLQFATIGSGIGLGLDIVSIPVVHGLCYLSTTTTVMSGIHYLSTGKAIVSSGNSNDSTSSSSDTKHHK